MAIAGITIQTTAEAYGTKGYISCPEHKPRKCGPACFGETPNPLD